METYGLGEFHVDAARDSFWMTDKHSLSVIALSEFY
jgi:hypothetical protein